MTTWPLSALPALEARKASPTGPIRSSKPMLERRASTLMTAGTPIALASPLRQVSDVVVVDGEVGNEPKGLISRVQDCLLRCVPSVGTDGVPRLPNREQEEYGPALAVAPQDFGPETPAVMLVVPHAGREQVLMEARRLRMRHLSTPRACNHG